MVATVGGGQITLGDVNHRLDAVLALDRLHGGPVLDPLRPADQPAIRQRQADVLQGLIDGTLLMDAARQAGLEPDKTAADQEIDSLTRAAGSGEKLAAELARNGVTVDDVRSLVEDDTLAGRYVARVLVPKEKGLSVDDAAARWLDAERARRGVKVLVSLDGQPSA